MGILRRLFKPERKKTQEQERHKPEGSGFPQPERNAAIGGTVAENLRTIRDIVRDDDSVVTGTVEIPGTGLTAGVVYLKGLVDEQSVSSQIISRLTRLSSSAEPGKSLRPEECIGFLKKGRITNISIKETRLTDELVGAILTGSTGLFMEGADTALIIATPGYEKRAIEKPELEVSFLGSKEAFVEDVGTNKAMVRKRLPTPSLRFKPFSIGRLSRTKVYVAWLEGIANPQIAEEVFRRLGKIDVDCVNSAGMIPELIEDNPLSLWPQYKTTELPDVVASNVTEGRIAIFCDGFPQVIIVPLLIFQEIQTPDDYNQKALTGSFIRVIRYAAIFISTMASPLYLSFVAYNHAVIPPDLAAHISTGRKGVPFPSVLEVLIMTLVIDLLREAGTRLPKSLGSAIGILGAVVIGQAAVAAGYVSPSVIIIISVSAIATFTIPSYLLSNSLRLVNYFLILLAAITGFFGVIIGAVFLWVQIISMRSFGIPLNYPATSGYLSTLRDVLIRAPVRANRKRPGILGHDNEIRFGESTVKPDTGKRKGYSK